MNTQLFRRTPLFMLFCVAMLSPALLTEVAIDTVKAETPQVASPRTALQKLLNQGKTQLYDARQSNAAIQTLRQAVDLSRQIGDRALEAESLVYLGEAQVSQGQADAAMQSYQSALNLSRKISDRQLEAAALLNIGSVYQNSRKDSKTALNYAQQALSIARTLNDRRTEAKARYNIGFAYFSQKNYPQAFENFQTALGFARQSQQSLAQRSLAMLGETSVYLGEAYGQAGEFSKAIERTEQGLAIAQNLKNLSGQAVALTNLGGLHLNMGNSAKALDASQQAFNLAKQIGDRRIQGMALANLGGAYSAFSDFTKAQAALQQGLTLGKTLNDLEVQGAVLGNLAGVQVYQEQYAEAIVTAQQGLAINQQTNNRLMQMVALVNLTGAYLNLGNNTEALKYQKQLSNLIQSIRVLSIRAVALSNVGTLYTNSGNYSEAIRVLENSLQDARTSKSRQIEANTLHALGLTYIYIGNADQGIDYLNQGLEIARSLGYRHLEATILGSRALAYSYTDQDEAGIQDAQTVVSIARGLKIRLLEAQGLNTLSGFYTRQPDQAKLKEYADQSFAIAQSIQSPAFEATALMNLGIYFHRTGNNASAIDSFQRGLRIAQQMQDRRIERVALSNLGTVLLKTGKLTEAERVLRQSIALQESMRQGLNDQNKIIISDLNARPYVTMQQVLVGQNRNEEALEMAERGRTRALSELLAQRQKHLSAIQSPSLSEIKQLAKTQNSTIVEYSIVKDDFSINGKFEPKESELFIWVIKPTGETTLRRVDLKFLWQQQSTTLETLVANSRELSGKREYPSLHQLYQLLIQPITDLLPQDPEAAVTFVPQQSLLLVPFAALQNAAGDYLIEKHTILTTPSIQVLSLTQQHQHSNNRTALVVGNPQMPSITVTPGQAAEPLAQLPGAEQEADTIAALLQTKAIKGQQATKANILKQLPQAGIVHLATHGYADNAQGFESWIALAPSGKDNGLLTATELMNLNLNSNLVVLSACETGRGKLTGDGVIGLSRSLIGAGASSVIVSLWSIPDDATSQLMTHFYQSLQRNPNKARSLRQAMLATMKQHPNPNDWAAFVLIGKAN